MGHIRLMNIAEIRRKYLEKLESKCSVCFNNIDSILVQSYNYIMKNKTIEVNRNRITSDFETDPWREDVKKRIQEHYAGNWDITIELRSHKKASPIEWWVFAYKGDLAEVVLEAKKVELEEEEKLERTGILDL